MKKLIFVPVNFDRDEAVIFLPKGALNLRIVDKCIRATVDQNETEMEKYSVKRYYKNPIKQRESGSMLLGMIRNKSNPRVVDEFWFYKKIA